MNAPSRAERIALPLFVVCVLSSLAFLVHPWYDARNDASMYIVAARSLAEGHGYSYLGIPFRVRPPGFPAMIAPLLGALGTDFFALNLFVSLFGAAAVVLLFLHQQARVGWILALLTAASVWLNPGYQRMCNQVMSDVPGLALLLFCLLVDRWSSRAPSWRREIALGVSIGLSTYVRAAIALLVPAIVVSRLLTRWAGAERGTTPGSFAARRLAAFAVAAGIVVAPWSVRNALWAPAAPADQTQNYDTATAMWHEDPGDPGSPRLGPGGILARVPANLRHVSDVLGSRMRLQVPGDTPSPRDEILYACLSLLLVGCLLVVALTRREPAELLAAGLLLVLLVYFGFADRLVLPVCAIALAASVEVAARLLRRAVGDRAATLAVSVLLLIATAVEFEPRRDWPAIEKRHRAYTEIASAVSARLAPGSRLASAQGFHYSVYLDRPVYGLIYAIRRAGRPEAAEETIDKYGIDTVVLSPLDAESAALFPYLERRYGRGEPAASAFLWRVRPRGANPAGG